MAIGFSSMKKGFRRCYRLKVRIPLRPLKIEAFGYTSEGFFVLKMIIAEVLCQMILTVTGPGVRIPLSRKL
jgi:hypothetical protein